MKKQEKIIFKDNIGIAKINPIKRQILINKKIKKKLNKKELNCLIEHEKFHLKFNFIFITLILLIIIFIANRINFIKIPFKIYDIIKIPIIIIIFIPLISWIIEILADIYSSKKNNKKTMIKTIKKLNLKIDFFHPSKKIRIFLIKIFS